MPEFNCSRNDPFGLDFHSGQEEIIFRLPKAGGQFDGHFDGYPIAPGALLLDWMLRKAEADHIPNPANALSRSRFMREVLPGDEVTVRSRPDRRGIVVEVLANGEVAARSWFSQKK